MKCPLELPVKKVVTHVTEAGVKYQVQIAEGKRALAAFLNKDEANYIVESINSHKKLLKLLKDAQQYIRPKDPKYIEIEQALKEKKQ